VSYTVLARKYRSQTFADMVGQEHISRTLGNAIKSGRIAHAFLFTGARGVGKTTTARLLAKALNCENGPTPEPCNACDPCREITNGVDMDVLEIDGASNNSVDDVRRLQESLPYRPSRDRFKVVIVDEVHMLSTGAFNAFLKTLEEPPPHVKFIFATTEIHKVPITIRSRCQRHDFRLIPHSLVAKHVRWILAQENVSADEEAIAIVVREAGGSMRDALTVLEQLLAFGGDNLSGQEVARGLGIADQQSVLATARALLDGDAAACVRAVAALGEQGLDVTHFARELLWLARDMVVLRVVGDDERLVDRPAEERSALAKVAAEHAPQQLERTFSGLSKLIDEAAESATPQLALEMGLVRLADRPPLQPLAALLERLHALEARLLGGGPSAGPGSGGGARRPPLPPPSAPTRGAARELREPPREQPIASSGPPSPPVASTPSPIASPTPTPSPSPIASPSPSPIASPSPSPTPSPSPSPIASPTPSPNRNPIPTSTPIPARASDVGAGLTPPSSPPATPPPAAAPAAPTTTPTSTSAADAGSDEVPKAWHDILGALRANLPALGAVLEHGVPVQVDSTCVRVSFPDGSFFGRQATTKQAREALAEAARRVLGGEPKIEVGYNLGSARASVAAAQAAQKKERRNEVEKAARNHPRVKDAMDVFEEHEVQVEVE